MTQGERIRTFREQIGLTLEELGKKTNTTPQTIYKYENDIVTNIPYDRIIALSKVLKVQPWEILGWDVPSYNSETGILTIPFITQKISAGIGEEELPDDCLEVKSIDILASMAKGISKKILTAAEVKGDSMIEANIYPGDIVIFARGRIEGDGIYVLALGGDVLVKRLQFDALSNELEIISMNKNYKTRTVSADADGLRILGKVVGWFHNEI